MRLIAQVAVFVSACSCCLSLHAEDARKGKPRIEIRWVESKPIEGVTESKGFQCSCDPDDLVYPHKKPALVLTGAEVEKVTMTNLDLSANGLASENYNIKFHLTKAARKKLADSIEGNKMRLLTVMVDGKEWGVHRYEKDKSKRVPESTRAESFVPQVGYMASRTEAKRIANAFK